MRSNAQFLSDVPLFRGVGLSSLDMFAEAAVRKRAERGEILFREGDEGGALYMILSGRVRIERHTKEGEIQVLGVRSIGEVVGEMSLVEHKPRSATAICDTNCKLLILQRAEFQRLIMLEPTASLVIMQTLSRRVREAADLLIDHRSKEVPERLLDLLRRESDEEGWVAMAKTQSDLAEIIGCSREAINRALQELDRQGKIERINKRLLKVRKA
ncbi:MAG: Crp/Fnr family transcriptional regulator [Fimbriimonadaceae bacterium]